jgi:asparagine synthase (glutamine-hydrolysing)
MIAAAPHLGPDGVRVWASGPAGLVHFQLVTTPEAVGEIQPLQDSDAGLVLVFDGRIDNREALRDGLPEPERPAADAPDSAFVLAAFAAWGERCPEKLVGEYAFVVWQTRARRLFCARSLKGFKPLVWCSDGRTFCFASEVPQLFAGGGMARRINAGYVGEVLASFVVSVTETLWEGIYSLPSGSAMTLENGQRREWRWHSGPFPEIRYKDERDYDAHFRMLFDQALRACLRSGGPVAADLSGGLDSSSVVCRTAELYRNGEAPCRVQPVSMVFPGEPQDETEWINLVAAHTCWEPMRIQPPPYEWDFWRSWSAQSLDLPLRPNAATRKASLENLCTTGCHVSLSGEGGDDWFRGAFTHWPDLLRGGRWAQLWQEVHHSEAEVLSPYRTLRRIARLGMWPLVNARYQERIRYRRPIRKPEIPSWIAPDWARSIGLADRIGALPEEVPLSGLGQRILYEHNLLYAFPLNRGIMRLHAQHAVEWRHPFHDQRLIEFALSVPGNQMRSRGQKKRLLRRALQGTLPEPIRLRLSKAEFSAPIHAAATAAVDTSTLAQLREMGWVKVETLFPQGALASEGLLLGACWNALAVNTWLQACVL